MYFIVVITAVNVLLKIKMSIENFYFVDLTGVNRILFACAISIYNETGHLLPVYSKSIPGNLFIKS